jgi:hypothetical protein
MRIASAFLLLLSTAAALAGEEAHPELSRVMDRLRPWIETRRPEATVTIENGRLLVRHRTRTYLAHPLLKTGDYAAEPREMEGPDREGFRLELSVKGPKFAEVTARVYPRTVREPYWSAHCALLPLKGGEGFLHLVLRYGARCPRELLEDLLGCLAPDGGADVIRIELSARKRYGEGEPIRIDLRRLGGPGDRPLPARWEDLSLVAEVRADGEAARFLVLSPNLARFLAPPPGPAPTRENLMDLTSEFWRGARGPFRPEPGVYRLTMFAFVAVHRAPPGTRANPYPARGHLQQTVTSNTVEFEVVLAEGPKEDR